MKVLDVQDLFGSVDKTLFEINNLQNKLKKVLESVNGIVTLDDSFAGQGAIAIKSYYAESHIPFIGLFGMILEDYREALQNLKSAVSSYESSQSGFIRQAFLEGDVVKSLNKVREVMNSLTGSANSVILGVRDIVATKLLDSYNVHAAVNYGRETVENHCEELEKLDRKESDHLKVFYEDLQLLKSYLTDISERFSKGEISILHFDSSMLGEVPNYNKMIDRLEKYEEGLVDPPIVSFDPSFLVDAPDDYYGYATEVLDFKDLYQKVRQGFKIERDVIRKFNNGAVNHEYKFRVYKPELVGINPPKKGRNYKLYESSYIQSQVKHNLGSLKVANYVDYRSGAVNALKSKAGWVGIAIGTGWGIYENIKEGESVENIAVESVVDVGIGALSLGATGATAAVAITFGGVPVLVGAAVGFLASVGVEAFFNGLKIKGVSVGDHIKNGLKTVAGWFTGKK